VGTDPNTEIASGLTVGDYPQLRERLDAGAGEASDWAVMISAFHRRMRERFPQPIAELGRYDHRDELPMRPGFAILALDCLLIDISRSTLRGRFCRVTRSLSTIKSRYRLHSS
jgi:hypothetical protein